MGTKPETGDADRQDVRFTRELGLTHSEFFRSLPPAIDHRPFTVDGGRVTIEDGDRVVIIDLGPQQHRSIASLSLPYVETTFTFSGYTAAELAAFMARFERYFQRGGG